MTGRLSEAVGSVGRVHPVLRDNNPFSFIKDILNWILQLLQPVFDSIVHFATYIYESIERGIQYLVNACNGNPTCSTISKETQDFAVYWFQQFKDHIGFGSVVLVLAAFVILYMFWSTFLGCFMWCYDSVVVLVVRCCGFRRRGIRSRTPASSYMAKYDGYVPASSNCARYQSIGATGVVRDYHVELEDYDSGSDACCKKILGFVFFAVILFVAVTWFLSDD